MEVRPISMWSTLTALMIVSCFIGSIVAQFPPPRPPLNIIVIHGDVLCKNCTGTGPAEGSMVELRCNTSSGTPIIQSATVTSQGFFVIQMQRSDFAFQAKLCGVFPLSAPPNKICTEFADREIAANGAPLNFEATGGPSFLSQYNVTTFVWKIPK